MKKTLSLLLALILCLCASCSLAAGLSGLSGGLDGLDVPGGSGSASPLPDPSKASEEYGELLQSDYAFAEDYICDAYLYPRPRLFSDFFDSYSSICRRAGYTLTETTADGQDAYRIQSGSDHYALLVPDFGGQMLLLVQKGMEFDYQARTNYATLIYNNRDYEMELWLSGTGSFLSTAQWEMTFKAERAPFSSLGLYFPQTIRAGDVLYVDQKKSVKGFGIMYNTEGFLLKPSNTLYWSGDYCQATINTVKDVPDGVLIEGVIEGQFTSYDATIEEFVFSGIVTP